jgi:DNA-directed RNA polymerase specialized sigma24 family protein
MKDLEGLKVDQVADALEISVPAAKQRIRRARLFLRDKLETFMEN